MGMEIFLLCLVGLIGLLFILILSGIRFIPNNRIGVVEKRWSFGKGSVKSGLIALNGEAGYQQSRRARSVIFLPAMDDSLNHLKYWHLTSPSRIFRMSIVS
jgi:hypothetical protein